MLERTPHDPHSQYMKQLLEEDAVYEACYHNPPHPAIWCGAIFWTEQDLVDAYNSVSDQQVTTAQYITFCPYCLTYFRRYRPAFIYKRE